MEDGSSLSEQIRATEQLILLQSELYQNTRIKEGNIHSRIKFLERIKELQSQLEELKASQKGASQA